jgi:hypothetical protein
MRLDDTTGRRHFLKGASALSLAGGLTQAAPARRFNGIQMGPHTMLDEGLDRCLDLIQDTAAINAIMVYSHTYDEFSKPLQVLADDHGVPVRDMRKRKLPAVWVRHHEQAFSGTSLRHQRVDNSFEYAGRDILAELLQPCRKRGIQLYARILEDPAGKHRELFPGTDARRAGPDRIAAVLESPRVPRLLDRYRGRPFPDLRVGWFAVGR